MSTYQIEELVRRLAREHFDLEEGIERVIWVKNDGVKEIHLIEVNRNTFPEGKVLTFYLGATEEYPLPVRLADITPEEWDKVKSGLIPLPNGWSLDDIEIFEREDSLQSAETSQLAEVK